MIKMHLETFTRIINIWDIQQGGPIEKTFVCGAAEQKNLRSPGLRKDIVREASTTSIALIEICMKLLIAIV